MEQPPRFLAFLPHYRPVNGMKTKSLLLLNSRSFLCRVLPAEGFGAAGGRLALQNTWICGNPRTGLESLTKTLSQALAMQMQSTELLGLLCFVSHCEMQETGQIQQSSSEALTFSFTNQVGYSFRIKLFSPKLFPTPNLYSCSSIAWGGVGLVALSTESITMHYHGTSW